MMKYQSKLSLLETELAIKLVKDNFEKLLAKKLNLVRVSAPLFVEAATGINDDLTGQETPVGFKYQNTELQIIQSLAKWKRVALKRYKFKKQSGLYTDMNAIRQDEVLDNKHSLYVDQWDWELVIDRKQRKIDFLKAIVIKIYQVLLATSQEVKKKFPQLNVSLPPSLTFVTAEELVAMYPNDNPKKREDLVAKKHRAVFIIGIGSNTKEGRPHDLRSPDYDDWTLNGDLLVWHQPLNCALELSSMGIRVDAKALNAQLRVANQENRKKLYYHQQVLKNKLPLTIGGGIGQSRLCMFLLEKIHIGEVQAGYWPKAMIMKCEKENIFLL